MTTAGAAVLSLAVLGAAGAAPVVTIVGARWRALLLAPLAGAVLTAVAGACTLAIAGAIVPWFAALAVAAALASLAIGRRFPRARLPRRARTRLDPPRRLGRRGARPGRDRVVPPALARPVRGVGRQGHLDAPGVVVRGWPRFPQRVVP